MPSEMLDDAVELGYMTAPEYQGKGLAVECGQAILTYAAEVLDLEEIHLLTDAGNEASRKTACKLGFTEHEHLHQEDRQWIHYIWSVEE